MSGRRPDEIWEESLDEGERRLTRRVTGLTATGFAGGADVMFGIIALTVTAGALAEAMPYESAHILGSVVFGLGFMLIVIGRAELFTENFLIPVGTVHAGRVGVGKLLNMWVITLVFNLLGLAIFAVVFAVDGVLKPGALENAGELADTLGQRSFMAAMISAIAAGTVMTLFTWVIAASDSSTARILAALLIGFLLAAPTLNHAIVGFGEMIAGLFAGTAEVGYGDLARNTAIAVVGNLIGGVGLVFATRLAQVRAEPYSTSGLRSGERPAESAVVRVDDSGRPVDR